MKYVNFKPHGWSASLETAVVSLCVSPLPRFIYAHAAHTRLQVCRYIDASKGSPTYALHLLFHFISYWPFQCHKQLNPFLLVAL